MNPDLFYAGPRNISEDAYLVPECFKVHIILKNEAKSIQPNQWMMKKMLRIL